MRRQRPSIVQAKVQIAFFLDVMSISHALQSKHASFPIIASEFETKISISRKVFNLKHYFTYRINM